MIFLGAHPSECIWRKTNNLLNMYFMAYDCIIKFHDALMTLNPVSMGGNERPIQC